MAALRLEGRQAGVDGALGLGRQHARLVHDPAGEVRHLGGAGEARQRGEGHQGENRPSATEWPLQPGLVDPRHHSVSVRTWSDSSSLSSGRMVTPRRSRSSPQRLTRAQQVGLPDNLVE